MSTRISWVSFLMSFISRISSSVSTPDCSLLLAQERERGVHALFIEVSNRVECRVHGRSSDMLFDQPEYYVLNKPVMFFHDGSLIDYDKNHKYLKLFVLKDLTIWLT